VLTGTPGESFEIRVAPGSSTLIRSDARIVREAVEVDGRERFAILDPGDQTLTVEPSAPLGPKERVVVRVTFRDGSPASATFVLVPATSEVDTVISVNRPQQSVAACQAELVATQQRCDALERRLQAQAHTASPAVLALAGLLDMNGVLGARLLNCEDSQGELRIPLCLRLRATGWAVMVLTVHNLGKEPWVPVQATLLPMADGKPRTARALIPRQATIAPGEEVQVAVEVEMPQRDKKLWITEDHTLTVCDAGSRCLSVQNVKL
jgi:uncharacterized protein (TIGR02268 family)